MKNKKKTLCTILYIAMSAAICFGMSADALTRLYYPDGSNRLVGRSLVLAETTAGATYLPQTTMYAADGRTISVQVSQVEAYQNVGWYTYPVRTVYAADGRTLVIPTDETEAYIHVGWYTEPVRMMYAADGRTLLIPTDETAAYESVGWYTEPVIVMYAIDGRTLIVKSSEIAAYENVGWFTEPPIRVYAIDGRTLDIKNSELQAYLSVGWYQSPADFPLTGPMVALTFDDGPSRYTNRILDCLAAYNAKATFFVVGNSVRAYPDILKRAYDMGMEIGNHTMTHPNLKALSAEGVSRELSNAASAVSAITGAKPSLLRPPYGNYNSAVSAVSGMPLILWSIDTLDWKTRNADSTVNCVLSEVKDGSVILMHDLYDASAAAAERIIPALISRGYRLVTVSELAKAKGYSLTNGKAYSSFK